MYCIASRFCRGEVGEEFAYLLGVLGFVGSHCWGLDVWDGRGGFLGRGRRDSDASGRRCADWLGAGMGERLL